MAYNAGSVSAKIEIDTSEFDKSIKKLIDDVGNLKGELSNSGADQLSKDVEALKTNFNNLTTSIKELSETNKDYKKQLASLREEIKNTGNVSKDSSKEAEQLRKTLSELTNAKITPKGLTDFQNQWHKVTLQVKRDAEEIKSALSNLMSSNKPYVPKGIDNLTLENIKNASKVFNQWNAEAESHSKWIQEMKAQYGELYEQLQKGAVGSAQSIISSFRNMGDGVAAQKQRMARYADELKAKWNSMSVDLAKANAAQYKYWTKNGVRNQSGLMGNNKPLQYDYNAYLQGYAHKLDEVNAKIQEYKRNQQSINDLGKYTYENFELASRGVSLLNKELDKFSAEVSRYSRTNANLRGQIKQLQNQANLFGKEGIGKKALAQSSQQLNILSNRLNILTQRFQQGKITQDQYRTGVDRLEKELSELHTKVQTVTRDLQQDNLALNKHGEVISKTSAEYQKLQQQAQKTNNTFKQGQYSMREFGTNMGKAEAYSNNLYRSLQKVRSVIVSIKTIASMMGAMAIWNFAFELIDGVKETYAAKSEMDSLLKQTKWYNKGDLQGINDIHNALDKVTKDFQRINKYSLGETAASIGLEFNLKPDEIAKSARIIAMVQNEYARAGRTNEEAALAVKDILQGEFRRLSMETGVGKEELQEKYGWNGKKEDVMNLLEALEKAGKDRHWDIFAAKATSLNDVITITKNRFGELGADLVSNVEPLILSAFNGLMDGIDALKGHFEGLGSFGKTFTIGGGALGGFVAISTALMMFKRNMGLAEIATLGWGRSFGTALLGLNKTDVALHGLRKTLVATMSGTKAATVANIGLGKSILGRIAGVKHEIQAEHGLASAMMARKVELQKNLTMEKAAIIESGNLRQKIIYLAKGEVVANKSSATWSKTLKSLIFNMRTLKIVTMATVGVVALLGYAGIAAKADDAKKAIDSYNNVNKNGVKISENAQKTIDKYTEKLAGLTEGTKKYKQVSKQLEIAKLNKKDIDNANELLKTHNRLYDAQKASIEARREERFSDSLKLASDGKQLSTTSYEAQMQHAIDIRNKALDVYDSRLYKASQHINSQVSSMKEAGASEEKRVKYARDYQVEAENTARLWKEFNEGNLNSGFYAVLSELKLMWIDLWNNNHFTHFWNSVVKTWEDVKPTVYAIKDWLIGVGEALADFFSTDMGKFTLMAGGIGLVSLKIGKWVSGASSVFSVLKTVGGKVKDLAKGWKNVADNAEEASKKMPKTDTSTGGINGDVGTGSGTSWWQNTKTKLGSDATTYVRAAAGIAAAMLLVTEAIVLLRAPMGALAELGWQFKQWEPNIRKGIEGLKLIAPVMAVFLPPVIALMLITDKYAASFDIIPSFMASAELIAMGMALVAEAVFLLVLPMGAIAGVGFVKSLLGNSVEQGKEAIQLVTDTLVGLWPLIPVFEAAIIAGAIAINTEGIGALYMVGSLAIGMGLVATAVLTLSEPLLAIGVIGATFPDLSDARKGAEAIKLTAEVMVDVAKAIGLMALVEWELLAGNIAHIINSLSGVSLTDLTKDGGFFPQLNEFTKSFNEMEFTAITDDKVTALSNVATGLTSVNTAITQAKEAIDNLPPEFKNGQTLSDSSSLVYNGSQGGTTDTTSYFDQLKEPLQALSKFITEFNNGEYGDFSQGIDPTQINAITTAANMLEQVKNAVQKVNDVMWNTGMGNSIANMGAGANIDIGGLFNNGLSNLISGGTAGSGSSGSYVSSFGSQFQEVENIIKDLSTFSNNVSDLTSGDSNAGNVEALTTFVDGVKTQIDNLVTTLSDKVSQAKTNAKSLGTGIIDGIKSGLANLTTVGTGVPAKLANGIMTNKDMVYNTSNSLGKTTASKFKEGVDPMSEYMTWELSYVKSAMTDRKTELGDTAYDLGSHIASRFKEGDDINSPGIMARSMQDEVNYIGDYLTFNNLPQMAFNLAQSLGNNFKLDFGLSNLQLPDLSQFTSGLQVIPTTVGNIKTQVSTKFGEMKTGIQGSFNSILGKTKTSMANMKSATIGHIANIKTSWRGMQDALIASADHIKQQTGSKINQLKTNLGDFWNKIRHPDQLIGGTAGGKPQGSIRRRGRTGFAGSPLFKPKKSKIEPSDFIDKALLCQMQGEPCYAGWNFNWTKPITGKFKGWNTHFSKFGLDNFLNVGSFENSNFPVKGRADVFKEFIKEVIMGTTYDFYFNSKYGSPAEALRAGHFNCYDGMRIVMALASAFGLGASQSSGTWGGTPHSWATVQGIGAIDTTALQRGYGFTSPKVKGYHAGSIKRTGSNGDVPPSNNNSSNHNEVNIHIHGDVYGIDDLNKKIEEGANRVARRLFRNSLSGV